jgi:hypothetical protein
MTDKSALSVKECLEFIYMNFGVPVSIQADNGKEFRNRLLNEYHRDLNIRVIHGRPRNPRAQGQIERLNQTIKRFLSKALSERQEKRWIDVLAAVTHQYNTTLHRATNQVPFFLFHGQSGFNGPSHDLEVVENEDEPGEATYESWIFENEIVLHSTQDIHDQVMDHFHSYRRTVISNSNPNTVERRLEVGDRVLLKLDFDNNTNARRNAFDSFFSTEIYVVLNFLSNNMVQIKDEVSGETLNVFKNRLKKLLSSTE